MTDIANVTGVGVSPGVGAGPVRAMAAAVPEPPAGQPLDGDPAEAKRRAAEAFAAVGADLDARAAAAAARDRAEAGEVLAAQAMMARDPSLAEVAGQRIDGGLAAPRAVHEAFGTFRELLAKAGGYMAARVTDLDDIRDRVLAVLTGAPMPGVPVADEPFVLVARDLAPADTALIDPAKVVAFVTAEGGPTSHTAILARTMGIPAVVAAPAALDLPDGTRVLVDGATGVITVDPDEDAVRRATQAADALAEAVSAAKGPGRTADRKRVPLLANIGGPADVEGALAHGAEGVGLFRTEFLFLDSAEAPTFEQQVATYRKVLSSFGDGRVVVRTLDAGADKPLAFLPTGEEPNPALGERALRMMRHHPDMLDTQLRALAEAARGLSADLWVMAPMVADGDDAAFFVDAARAAGLTEEAAKVGVMVEIPAAALRARDFAGGVDFFSIGTNDLAQYAFAADRQLGALARFQDPWQPALLDLIHATAEAANRAGKSCGVCGEAAADPALACVLVGLGVSSLSMSAPSLPMVRAVLAAHTVSQCVRAADAARRGTSADTARELARAALPGLSALGL
ncbi:phosphoenolpyruvate--protein phosphotransferase [Phytomonospora endophytica]|uniref:Phosphoenolpyruvate-protein phosphotransferase n=1 Tax=Phytomonospora endophytica TaxID=714109 RepID=A0A841FMZ0_9ACTN|nr:phosphotransferase system enzyme I (PtsI) [Phytomonospora endophytica]GIG70726.1 phosphoenolpyruvate-protein phosphotransferase [Phytomonospora endophytica]